MGAICPNENCREYHLDWPETTGRNRTQCRVCEYELEWL